MDEKIKELIKIKRPNLSKNSVQTYGSIIKTVFNKAFNDEEFDEKKLNEVKKILEALKDINPRTRKTMLSALVVMTDNKAYKDIMLKDIDTYNKEEDKQVKNEKQEENWVDNKEIDDLLTLLEKEAKYTYKKSNPTASDYQQVQNYIILCLMGGKYIPPRRSKDYVDFKIKNIDKEKDNYIDKNKFVFNSYKTAKYYGKQEIEIPKALKPIITKWIKYNPTDYLLFDTKMKQLSNVKLNQRLNKLFDKKASVNALRHTYLSEKYGHSIDERNEMKKDFEAMGSSDIQEKNYIKKA